MTARAIPNILDVAARSHPDRVALTCARQTWTFSELHAAAVAAAAMLATTPSTGRIGILSANRPGFVFVVHAAARLGVPIVPLSWRQSQEEIAWQIRDAGVSLLLCDRQNAATATAIANEQPIQVIAIETLESGAPNADHAQAPPMLLDDDAAILYTSGTSGSPKGARITYGNLWFSAVASSLHLGHQPNDVWLAVLPLFHIGGLSIVFRTTIEMTGMILQEQFVPEDALTAMDSGTTMVSLVPTMLQRLLDTLGDDPWPASPRCILLGGAPTPPPLLEACLARGIPAAPTYGLTESTAQVATLLPSELERKRGSSGRPLPVTSLRIMTDDGIAKPGEIGEVEFSGPTRFVGYLHDATNSDIEINDWFPTGDVGYVDEDGFLYLVDRRHDLIVSGGENIYPAQVEAVLLEHPEVADAGVVGTPDNEWGARPVAFVVWHGEPKDAHSALLAHCRMRLAAFKAPDRFIVLDELPRTASGKLLRRSLRELALSLAEQPIAPSGD